MTTTIKQCNYIITKGLKKGLFCITKKCNDDGFCKKHSKKSVKQVDEEVVKIEKVDDTKEEVVEEEECSILSFFGFFEEEVFEKVVEEVEEVECNKCHCFIKHCCCELDRLQVIKDDEEAYINGFIPVDDRGDERWIKTYVELKKTKKFTEDELKDIITTQIKKDKILKKYITKLF